MIVVRNVFQLKFGMAREALDTLVLENTFESLAEFESSGKEVMGNEEWRTWYGRFSSLGEGGHPEIFTIVQ